MKTDSVTWYVYYYSKFQKKKEKAEERNPLKGGGYPPFGKIA